VSVCLPCLCGRNPGKDHCERRTARGQSQGVLANINHGGWLRVPDLPCGLADGGMGSQSGAINGIPIQDPHHPRPGCRDSERLSPTLPPLPFPPPPRRKKIDCRRERRRERWEPSTPPQRGPAEASEACAWSSKAQRLRGLPGKVLMQRRDAAMGGRERQSFRHRLVRAELATRRRILGRLCARCGAIGPPWQVGEAITDSPTTHSPILPSTHPVVESIRLGGTVGRQAGRQGHATLAAEANQRPQWQASVKRGAKTWFCCIRVAAAGRWWARTATSSSAGRWGFHSSLVGGAQSVKYPPDLHYTYTVAVRE